MARDTWLVIDVGGTRTRVGVCEARGQAPPENVETYHSRAYADLEAIIRDYKDMHGMRAASAVIGVAGPVDDGAARATNLPWRMDEKSLERALGFSRVRIINDVEALGHAIAVLNEADLEVVHDGRPRARSPVALIAPGTGLGQAFLVPRGDTLTVHPSEGGHSDFAPTSELGLKLLAFLLKRRAHVSYERVCSGPGIARIYRFLKEEGICREPPWLRTRLETAEDVPAAITQTALSGAAPPEITVRTVDLFVSILGAEAGNMAMRFNARGGIYIGGGIAPNILHRGKQALFREAFLAKGRLSDWVSKVPVMLIRKPEPNLHGLAHYAREMMGLR